MNALIRRIVRLALTGSAAIAFVAAPTALVGQNAPEQMAQPCYNGVIPGQPFLPSCTLPGPTHKIPGSAPDANAIIACKNLRGCLAWYVNGPW
jgi:hypothetical protein